MDTKKRDEILGKWQHQDCQDYYAHTYLGRNLDGTVDVWDCRLNKFVWVDMGRAAFVYRDAAGRWVKGQKWEEQFLLFPRRLFPETEIRIALGEEHC